MKPNLPLALLITSITPALADPSSRLEALRDQHRTELRAAIRPAVEDHAWRLKELKERLLAQGELEAAFEVEVERANIAGSLAAAEMMEALEGTWRFTTTKNVFHIAADGTVQGGKPGVRLQIVDKERRLVRISAHLWRLSEDGARLSGAGLDEGSPHPAKKLK